MKSIAHHVGLETARESADNHDLVPISWQKVLPAINTRCAVTASIPRAQSVGHSMQMGMLRNLPTTRTTNPGNGKTTKAADGTAPVVYRKLMANDSKMESDIIIKKQSCLQNKKFKLMLKVKPR